jgi:glycine dehydrogenase
MKQFIDRHTGLSPDDEKAMLAEIGASSIAQLMRETVPAGIIREDDIELPTELSEHDLLDLMRQIGSKNKLMHSFIGQGYYGTITPTPILRNVLENPGWYTQYTPYQAEISQGRLEALLNFQTVVTELTGFPLANASLLDEGTAAAEAMVMAFGLKNKRVKVGQKAANVFIVDQDVFPQTIDVLRSRASSLHIEIEVADLTAISFNEHHFGILIQYPGSSGAITSHQEMIEQAKEHGIMTIMAADLMALTLITPPAELGADVAVGTTQRFGIPMGAGGPHAAYFACNDEYKRIIPGRIIGVSKDRFDNPTYRMALQTREQHIKREKATSNICTAQALLAVMAGFYAVYHGPEGIKNIAIRIHDYTKTLAADLSAYNLLPINKSFFDTITYELADAELEALKLMAVKHNYNFYYRQNSVSISFDETTKPEDIDNICHIFNEITGTNEQANVAEILGIQERRLSTYLAQSVFNSYQDETSLMRYMKSLENKDLSLVHSMIPLGSCTMKLNAAVQLMPLSWPEFSAIHPFAPLDQRAGYQQIFDELSTYLCSITGFTACSLMPNSGAQGEYSGLKVIEAYHHHRGDHHRDIALIPSSAHGTNPASAIMAGMKVIVVPCDEKGNIVVSELRAKAIEHRDHLACLMVTYPSTHGVFEESIKVITSIIHEHGGLVYLDGANMNAQIGYTSPGTVGADVCHLNLHKTFAIPHGGGGPGMGPICVNDKLAPFLPSHTYETTGGKNPIHAVSAAPYGSASILLISYSYIRLLGVAGLTRATEIAILNANYLLKRLEKYYDILYTGANGRCAHEFILDLRPFKSVGVQAEDIAKRLMDYGFHAPTLSFPVAGTFMIEPTESESKSELDLFISAMASIKDEIDEVARGDFEQDDNVLVNAPHPLHEITADEWNHKYSRTQAAYPLPVLHHRHKFWVNVARVDNAFGDRNLVCTCPPMEVYMQES